MQLKIIIFILAVSVIIPCCEYFGWESFCRNKFSFISLLDGWFCCYKNIEGDSCWCSASINTCARVSCPLEIHSFFELRMHNGINIKKPENKMEKYRMAEKKVRIENELTLLFAGRWQQFSKHSSSFFIFYNWIIRSIDLSRICLGHFEPIRHFEHNGWFVVVVVIVWIKNTPRNTARECFVSHSRFTQQIMEALSLNDWVFICDKLKCKLIWFRVFVPATES